MALRRFLVLFAAGALAAGSSALADPDDKIAQVEDGLRPPT